jgi:hypothetical protein
MPAPTGCAGSRVEITVLLSDRRTDRSDIRTDAAEPWQVPVAGAGRPDTAARSHSPAEPRRPGKTAKDGENLAVLATLARSRAPAIVTQFSAQLLQDRSEQAPVSQTKGDRS